MCMKKFGAEIFFVHIYSILNLANLRIIAMHTCEIYSSSLSLIIFGFILDGKNFQFLTKLFFRYFMVQAAYQG